MNADLVLICHLCRESIEGDTGALRVTFAELAEHRQREAEWKASHAGELVDLTDMLLAPEDVHWRAYHDRCDPDFEQSSYQIDAMKLRTWRDLARWTAHLMGKNWFPFTDWDDLLREAAGEWRAVRIKVLAGAR